MALRGERLNRVERVMEAAELVFRSGECHFAVENVTEMLLFVNLKEFGAAACHHRALGYIRGASRPDGGFMDIACALAPVPETPDHIRLAERLGYRRAWVYDTPALQLDVWVTLARAADTRHQAPCANVTNRAAEMRWNALECA